MRRPRLPKGLRGQLLLLLLASLVLTHVLSVWLFFDERRLAVRAAVGEQLAGNAVNVTRLIESAPPTTHAAILHAASSPRARFTVGDAPAVEGASSRRMWHVQSRVERLLGDRDQRDVRVRYERRPGDLPPTAAAAPARGDGWRRGSFAQPRAAGLTLSIRLQDGRWLNLQTAFRRPPLQSAWPTLVALGLMALAILAVVWFAVRSIAGPMAALAEAADRFGRGGEAQPVPLQGPTEVRVVTEAFNAMQERIERFVKEHTALMAALGHDLRSPLTALRVRAELVDDDETRDRLVASIEEMQAMVEVTLAYARGVADHETPVQRDLRGLVDAVAAEIRAGGGTVIVVAGDALEASVRPTALKRALRNVIANAVRYGGGASVWLERRAERALIHVDDEGPGIPEDQRARVFEPYTRLETSRSRETGGIGLGLAIARSILQAHSGSITLANRPTGGLRATLAVPVRPVAAPTPRARPT